MKKTLCSIAFIFIFLSSCNPSQAAAISPASAPTVPKTSTQASPTPYISISPKNIIQGDPIMITVNNSTLSNMSRVVLSGPEIASTSLPFSNYNGKVTSFYGVSFHAQTGKYFIKVYLKNNKFISTVVIVGNRIKNTEDLGVPADLGGNNTNAAEKLLTSVASETVSLNSVKSLGSALWHRPFMYALKSNVVTDIYGVVRSTGSSAGNIEIAHLGTDFKAPVGTPVYAMNSGEIAMAQFFSVYGNMVDIDHGLGIETLYLHLSKILVKPGQTVSQGQEIGLSGETGDAEGPHLHISVHINNNAIDPLVFMSFFGK